VKPTKEMKRMRPIALTAVLVVVLATAAARAATITVHPGESIQAAIDGAAPGTTIRVAPGVYHEAGAVRALTITASRIRLVGAARRGQPVVLEQSGTQTQGIWVSPDDSLAPDDVELPPCGVSGRRLADFHVSGFTVRNFGGFGIYLACVDGFRIDRNVAQDNRIYAIFPVRSSGGRMSRNTASGTHSDACLYVGQDERILVDHNRASSCEIGLQIEDSQHVKFTQNTSTGNTVGMIVDVLNGRQVKTAADNVVSHNVFRDNNRPNLAPPDEETSMLPPGIGLIVDGADRTLVTGNTFAGHAFVAMTLVDFCTGQAPDVCAGPLDIEPNPDGNRVVGNRFVGNTADVIYFPAAGHGNCFARNRPSSLKTVGVPLAACGGS
jgi:parallel beta-helix repeat protein